MDSGTLLRFNRQVRHALFETLSSLPPADFVADVGISFDSLQNTLFHVLRVEDFWVNVFLQGGQHLVPREARDDLNTVEDLARRWADLSDRTEAYIGGLSKEELAETREHRRGEEVVRKTVEEYLFTFLIHEIYHKGEVLAVLWQGDHEPPAVDYWRY